MLKSSYLLHACVINDFKDRLLNFTFSILAEKEKKILMFCMVLEHIYLEKEIVGDVNNVYKKICQENELFL